MIELDIEDVKKTAKLELKDELFREAVKLEIARLKETGDLSFWDKIFPYKLIIIKK